MCLLSVVCQPPFCKITYLSDSNQCIFMRHEADRRLSFNFSSPKCLNSCKLLPVNIKQMQNFWVKMLSEQSRQVVFALKLLMWYWPSSVARLCLDRFKWQLMLSGVSQTSQVLLHLKHIYRPHMNIQPKLQALCDCHTFHGMIIVIYGVILLCLYKPSTNYNAVMVVPVVSHMILYKHL